MNIPYKSALRRNSSFYTIPLQLEHTGGSKTTFPVQERSPTLTNNELHSSIMFLTLMGYPCLHTQHSIVSVKKPFGVLQRQNTRYSKATS